jgi:beta-lactamase class A
MIQNEIEDRISNLEGKLGIYYYNLDAGTHLFAGNNDEFHSSGISKLLLLIEVFSQIENGVINKNDTHILNENDFSYSNGQKISEPSYGVLSYLHSGLELTISDLCYLMITVTDNTAFNILLKIVGIDNVNKTMENFGYKVNRINREFFDKEKISRGIDNYHSVREIANVFYRLYLGQMISSRASAEILSILKDHQRRNIIPYHFPEDFPVAHQTGFDDGIIHDVGIVYGDHPFILCMCASDVDTRKAEGVMRDITLMCYNNAMSTCSK